MNRQESSGGPKGRGLRNHGPEFGLAVQLTNTTRVVVGAKLLLAIAVALGLCFASFNTTQFRSAYARWPERDYPNLSSRFATWDIAHYLQLSQEGYKAGSASCAFYPLWPLVIRAATALTGGWPVLTSLVLTNVLSLIGLWLLYQLVERHFGASVSLDSLILMLAFPGALFFSFPYSESLYLVILMLLFWSLELKRWFWTSLAAFLLPLTRPVGIFIVLPLTWFLYEQWRNVSPDSEPVTGGGTFGERTAQGGSRPESSDCSSRSKSALIPPGFRWSGLTSAATDRIGRFAHRQWLLLLCPLLGCATYFGTMYAWTGNAFEGFEAQKAYPNSPSIKNMFDLPAFWSAFTNVLNLDGMMNSALDRGFFLLFLALLPAVWKLNRTWFWYVLPTGLVPAMTSYFMSYRRYIMVLFPLFIVLAQLLAKGPRWMFWYYVILLAALQAWAVFRFVNFNWAG